ncbi:unnamed protein product (macronuclear) [Paramecium tetraurelia]|uniref:Uncharacterized protein n=1 Tax=Paramecium tetraurelia TaxID=5888 RepID=A0DSG4_PARTE|nr:uncharacterized protein GSPATT00019685001 [Paramecium tetraurelia]CAK85981.1 unnamed protein product [Paramecium tetraurelia]|eukprot:XP_001453378.1 hypothetical protein (macronuclear) [Paramecium tetraurelia strain d4-2]
MKKKSGRHQSKKQSYQNKGQEVEEILSQEEDTQDFSELEENQQYVSIVEWKKLQEDSSKKMTGNNLIVSQRSQNSKDFLNLDKVPLKSCLKKTKKDIYVQYEELFGKYSEDQLQTEISSEKLQLNQQQIKQCIIVTEFNNIMNDDDDEISITLDELDDLIYEEKGQKKNEKFDISQFDNIKKRIELNQNIQFNHCEIHNN